MTVLFLTPQDEARERGEFLAFNFQQDEVDGVEDEHGSADVIAARGGVSSSSAGRAETRVTNDVLFTDNGGRVQRVAVDGIQVMMPLPNMQAPRWLQEAVTTSTGNKRK